MQEMQVQSLGQEDPLEEGMATHSNILSWRLLWTEEPGRLRPIGSQRVRDDWSDLAHTHAAFHYLTGNYWSGCFFFLFCLMITSLKFLSICIALLVFVLQDSSKVVFMSFWYMKTSYIKHEDSFYWSFCMYEDLGSEWIELFICYILTD